MKLPRGVSGDRLVSRPEKLGYGVVRQKGTHVRLRHQGPPAHTITIFSLHNPLKTGILHAILTEGRAGSLRTPGTPLTNCFEAGYPECSGMAKLTSGIHRLGKTYSAILL